MLTVYSPAKINLVLEVLKRDVSGYHQISTIFHEIGLHDVIHLEEQASGFDLVCNDNNVPLDQNNTIYKAFKLVQDKCAVNRGLRVILVKNIPLASGLGGGSSNAAAVLKALNKLWNLKLTPSDLKILSTQIGMDVPFFIEGGTALGSHFGEQVRTIEHELNLCILVLHPNITIDTCKAYLDLNMTDPKPSQHTKACLESIEKTDLTSLVNTMHNDFAAVIYKKYPQIKALKESLEAHCATKAMLAGSGSSVFGVFTDIEKLKQAEKHFRSQGVYTWRSAS